MSQAVSIDRSARVARLMLYAGAGLLSTLFILAASLRRLNFDEALALRSGWLLAHHLPGAPDFYMPTTIFLGMLGSLLQDPGAVFLIARLLAAGTVLFCLVWSFRLAGVAPKTLSLCLVLVLLNGAFITHGLEFRYDWALLVGWLLSFGYLVRSRNADYLGLGVLTVWLASHHLKGLFFAASLYLIVLGYVLFFTEDRQRKLTRYHAALFAGAVGWIIVTALLGQVEALVGVYTTFKTVAGEQAKLWPWAALHLRVEADAVWWIGALAALFFTGYAAWRQRGLRPEVGLAVVFLVVPVGFLFVHPHPWPYMLALPVPFAAFLMGCHAGRRLSELLVVYGLVVAFILLPTQVGRSPLKTYEASFFATRTTQVATLRILKTEQHPDDTILDPTGLAYFVPPCTTEWYLDALFVRLYRQGAWMKAVDHLEAGACTWVLQTYRLNMLSPATREKIEQRYTSIGAALRLDAKDARNQHRHDAELPRHAKLRSFW